MANTDQLMLFDPADGTPKPYPSHAAQWRLYHGEAAWLFNPWTGERRNAWNVGSDVKGMLINPSAKDVFVERRGTCACRVQELEMTDVKVDAIH